MPSAVTSVTYYSSHTGSLLSCSYSRSSCSCSTTRVAHDACVTSTGSSLETRSSALTPGRNKVLGRMFDTCGINPKSNGTGVQEKTAQVQALFLKKKLETTRFGKDTQLKSWPFLVPHSSILLTFCIRHMKRNMSSG